MGLDPKSDSYAAYCFDEATFMWGRHVEGEIHRASRDAKNQKQASRKAEMRFQTLMKEPEEVSENDEHKDFPKHLRRQPAPTKFRDPMSMMKKK